jgi:hypothetical protein
MGTHNRREGFEQNLDVQDPAIATGLGETFQEFPCDQWAEVDLRLLRKCEGQVDHFIRVMQAGRIDRVDAYDPEQPNQFRLLRDVGDAT